MDLQEAIQAHDNGSITTDQFTEIVRDNQKRGIFWIPSGKNQSRFGFLHHHIFTKKGQFLQNVLKKYILREIDRIHTTGLKKEDISHLQTAINTIHFSWKHFYDKDAFIYADPRLSVLDLYLKANIIYVITKENQEMVCKTIDIVLGIAKEDVYYRARLFNYINLLKELPLKNTSIDIRTIDLFTREYINTYFHDEYPRKHDFMNKLVDILITESKKNFHSIDMLNIFIQNFPFISLAPGEKYNITRWY